MIKYEIAECPFNTGYDKRITKDGHFMFLEDILKDLKRLAFLENKLKGKTK
jgi:hypothetical protein